MSDIEHKVTFSDLPFKPVRGQVIYVDSDNNNRINTFIVNNYDWIRKTFRDEGLDFCYLPLLGEELIAYHAPYLSIEQRQDLLQSVPSIASFIKMGDEESLPPSLLYALDDEGDNEMRLIPIEIRWYSKLKKVFSTLADSIRRELASHYATPHQEGVVNETGIRFSVGGNDDSGDYIFDAESEILIREIKERIETLMKKGVNTMILHDIVDRVERLSSLHITKDYRIFLPEYNNNLEIVMPALPKAVYLLFLKHPEGIRFKDLVDYHDELLNIYRALNPIGGTQRQRQSIQEITNPMSNSINEKCARIREAFVKHIDDRLAQNYYITGKKGEPKRIILAPSLVVWEQ